MGIFTKNKKTAKKNSINFKLISSHPVEVFHPQSEEVETWRIFKIMAEFVSGFEFLHRYTKTISVFGSARLSPKNTAYQDAQALANRLSKKGFTVITGGGPGIMEAANKGAHEAGGNSVGLNIRLKNGSVTERRNPFVQESESFDYFFVRKVMLSFAAEAYVFFPGGFGTLDEFFEMVTLIQTQKIPAVPIVLVNKAYWTPLLNWIEKTVYAKYKAVAEEDMKLYVLVDTAEEALKVICKLTK